MHMMVEAMALLDTRAEALPAHHPHIFRQWGGYVCQELYFLIYNLTIKCANWRKWLVRAIRVVQCISLGGAENHAMVTQSLKTAPIMTILMIRFMSIFTERTNKLS